jgi:ribosomal protein L29
MAQTWPKSKELRTLPEVELHAQLLKARQKLWQDRLKAREGALQQTHELRLTRRQIARVQTVLSAHARQRSPSQSQPREATTS